mmetsp:Transcript_8301/g.17328  ORF Transcript_8301/g.17328 Transcript_8301/m.17328 type:complete len:103 (-) Transcript_8301:261-569(-)
MNKFITALLIVAIVASSTSAFTTNGASRTVTRKQPVSSFGPSFEVPSAPQSTTALNLKVKVDPNAKGNKNVTGNAKMAAYGGSIVFAALLPIAFLVWSAISK